MALKKRRDRDRRGGSERRRVSRDRVRDNAKKGAGGGGTDWFKLPDGVRVWKPEEAGTVELRILPYEVSISNHPDKVKKGELWYKLPFTVFHEVGPARQSIVSPSSMNLPCPLMEELQRLKKDYNKNKDRIKAMRMQKFVAFIIQDPDDEDKYAIYAPSRGKFPEQLEQELEEGDDDIVYFYDVNQDGRKLKVRFSEDTYEKNTFLTATKIEFVEADELDEDEVLDSVPKLDRSLALMSYEEIEAAMNGDKVKTKKKGRSQDDELEEEDEKPRRKKRQDDEDLEDEEDLDEEDEDLDGEEDGEDDGDEDLDDEDEPADDDDDDAGAEDDEDEPADDDEDDADEDDEEPEDEDEDPKPRRRSGGGSTTGRKSKTSKKDPVVKKGKTSAKKTTVKSSKTKARKTSFKKGEHVMWDDGSKDGKIIKLSESGKKALVKDDDTGDKGWVFVTDLESMKD